MDTVANKEIQPEEGDNTVERRRYYRIDDAVALQTQKLKVDEIDKELAAFEERRDAFCIMNSMTHDKEQSSPQWRVIETDYPEVAAYLKALEARIDSLAKIVVSQEKHKSQHTQKVNISAQGIRFLSSKTYDVDDMVELRLQIFPSCEKLLIIGTVVWCIEDRDTTPDERYAIAIDFSFINEADREVLIRHIHNKQIKHIHEQNIEQSVKVDPDY